MAEKNPIIADVVVEYNHYLLKGDLKRKKELLKHLADAIEPNKRMLMQVDARVTDDFFYLINNMDIRHNNCDQSDVKKYNAKFSMLSNDEKEEWYDIIYDQGLTLFIILEQQKRSKKIKDFKTT